MTTISQERSRLDAVGMRLRQHEQWGAVFDYTTARTVDEPANRAFVHISVTNPGNYSSNDAHVRAIERIGIYRFPHTGASYNRGITMDGTRYEMQPIGRRGAHTVNDFRRSTCSTSGCPSKGESLTAPNRDWNLNYNARAYVVCQNVGDPVSDAQLDSLARAVAADMLAGFVTRTAPIHGHRCCSAKSCPADYMWRRMGELEQRVAYYLTSGVGASSPDVEDDMIGLKKGDEGQQVKGLQSLLQTCGFDPGPVDGIYGSQTSAALLALRKAEGSSVDSGDYVSGWAYTQIHRHLAKKYAGKDGEDGDKGDPGRLPTAAEIQAAIDDWMQTNGSTLQPSPDQIAQIVAEWMEQHRDELRGEPGKTPTTVTLELTGNVTGVE